MRELLMLGAIIAVAFCLGYVLYQNGFLVINAKSAQLYMESPRFGKKRNCIQAKFSACNGVIKRVIRLPQGEKYRFVFSTDLTRGRVCIEIYRSKKEGIVTLSRNSQARWSPQGQGQPIPWLSNLQKPRENISSSGMRYRIPRRRPSCNAFYVLAPFLPGRRNGRRRRNRFRRPDPSQCAAPIIFVAREAPACRGWWRRKGLLCKAFSVASWTWAKKGAAAACKMTPAIFPQLERDAFGVPSGCRKSGLRHF